MSFCCSWQKFSELFCTLPCYTTDFWDDKHHQNLFNKIQNNWIVNHFLSHTRKIHPQSRLVGRCYTDQESLFSGRVEKVTLQKPVLSLWDRFLVRCSLLSSFLNQMAVSGFLSCDSLTSWRGQKAGGSGDFTRWEIRQRRAKTGIIHPLFGPWGRINRWLALSCVALHQPN